LSIESPPTIIGCRSGVTQGRFVIVDMMNWFPAKVSEIGEAINLPANERPPYEASDGEWFTYSWRDAHIVFDAFAGLSRWVERNDMGMFRYTGAAQALAAFRHRFMPTTIYLHDNIPIKVIERAGYFGGRFEVFKMGQIRETVYQYDINSLFPSV